ncbi:MAG: cysteine desulfurase family protein [Verrucomicrobiia bacterium]|jgi:cysteine desulfurase
MGARIYLDNAATTPLDPRVLKAMLPFLDSAYGNASSLHWAGRQAREAVETARRQVAELLHAEPSEIVFTASGTEADNMALVGVVDRHDRHDCHIITSAIEHPAVLETCRYLKQRGIDVTLLRVGADGIVDPSDLRNALRPNTRLVSIMAANNVVGSIQPTAELGRIARDHGTLFHTDAVQAAGKVLLDVRDQPIDLLSLSAHKLHGPKGIGALYVRKGVALEPLIHGGGQERGLRSATENVAGIVGFGAAAEIARAEREEEGKRLTVWRDRIVATVTERLPNAYLLGHPQKRLPGHICLGFAGQEGEAIKLLLTLDEAGIAVSSGSACSAHHAGQPSGVLLAMGLDPIRARGSLRVTLGRFNTEGDVDRFLEVLPGAVAALRPMTSRNDLSKPLARTERSVA